MFADFVMQRMFCYNFLQNIRPSVGIRRARAEERRVSSGVRRRSRRRQDADDARRRGRRRAAVLCCAVLSVRSPIPSRCSGARRRRGRAAEPIARQSLRYVLDASSRARLSPMRTVGKHSVAPLQSFSRITAAVATIIP
eukprot:6212164-Pleurochrysis_carterae.AAC.4